MSSPKLVEVDDGVQVFTTSAVDARFLYREIFTYNGYGQLPLPPRAYVVDVGANIGLFLLRVKDQCPDAEVIAFEPMPDLAEVVRRNVELRGYQDVTVIEVGLGDVAQTAVPFTYYPMLPSNSTRYPQSDERLKESMARTYPERLLERMSRSREILIDVGRLSTYLADDRPIDLLKIDTSGSEIVVLRGIDRRHWPLIRRMVFDVHDKNGLVEALCEALSVRGFASAVRPAPMAGGDGLNFLIDAVPREA